MSMVPNTKQAVLPTYTAMHIALHGWGLLRSSSDQSCSCAKMAMLTEGVPQGAAPLCYYEWTSERECPLATADSERGVPSMIESLLQLLLLLSLLLIYIMRDKAK